MPAPGFSGGSVQFTAGEKTESQTSSFLMRKTYREGTAAILLERPSFRQRDRLHWTPPSDCPTLVRLQKNTKHLLISLKVGVVRFTAVADTGVEVCWRSVPDEHYLVPFRRLKQILWGVFANEGLHLEGRGIAPRHKSPVCRFLSMFGSNCIPSTFRRYAKV